MNLEAVGQLRRIFARLTSSRFVRNVTVIGGGIAAAQAINFTFTPFITRLYGPEAFGVSASFIAIVSIITPLATLGYAHAIVMPKSDEGALDVARLSILSGLILATLMLLFLYVGLPFFAIWAGVEQSPQILYLIPLALLLSAFLSVANQMAIREGRFVTKARAYVESILGANLGKLAGGLIAPSGLLLIVLSLAGQGLNLLMHVLRFPKSSVLKPTKWFGLGGVQTAAKMHKDFALYRMPQGVIRAVSLGLPVILLTNLFGPAYAGQYSLAILVLGAPVMLLGESVGEVLYPKITRAINSQEGNPGSLIGKAAAILALLGCIPFGMIGAFGDVIMPWIFGVDWARAGEYAQWASIWMIALIVSQPAIAAMPASGMQSTLLGYEIVITAARIIALYAGFQIGDDLTSIVFYSLVNAVGSFALLILVLQKLKCR